MGMGFKEIKFVSKTTTEHMVDVHMTRTTTIYMPSVCVTSLACHNADGKLAKALPHIIRISRYQNPS